MRSYIIFLCHSRTPFVIFIFPFYFEFCLPQKLNGLPFFSYFQYICILDPATGKNPYHSFSCIILVHSLFIPFLPFGSALLQKKNINGTCWKLRGKTRTFAQTIRWTWDVEKNNLNYFTEMHFHYHLIEKCITLITHKTEYDIRNICFAISTSPGHSNWKSRKRRQKSINPHIQFSNFIKQRKHSILFVLLIFRFDQS